MDVYSNDEDRQESRRGSARERQRARNERRSSMVAPTTSKARRPQQPRLPIKTQIDPAGRFSERAARARLRVSQGTAHLSGWRRAATMRLHDVWWRVSHDPRFLPRTLAVIAVLFVLFGGFHILSGRLFPNVWTMGIDLGGLTYLEAETQLREMWERDLRITLVDGDRAWEVSPIELGLTLDTRQTIDAARTVGMAGLPFGYGVLPTVSLNFQAAQNTLMDMLDETKIDPYNAGYRWEDDQLVGVEGTPGRFLDVALTMAILQDDLAEIVDAQRLHLAMTVLTPDVVDPTPHLAQAQQIASGQFLLNGYDPFIDEWVRWTTDAATLASWLEAGETSLLVREDAFAPFITAQNNMLNQADEARVRFIDANEAVATLNAAFANGESAVDMRIRYRAWNYVVERGDTGYRIAFKTGIPFFRLLEENPSRDWDALLNPGEVVRIPTWDITVPLDPVPDKRIVVDIDQQYLVAYENGEAIRHWSISTGINAAPTSPGIFQILDHHEVAHGSSYTLCSANGCGQWEMYWFMGLYEVIPGLVNGFHGHVLLPNGRLLGDGNVGRPYTLGCVMSDTDNAEWLYNWADEGTIVEIISGQFDPQSDVGRHAYDFARDVNARAHNNIVNNVPSIQQVVG
ncbi:MAG: L,D-transpeptidase family protein [Chloroflexi bacterium]|nr:L,D-transpeptidase family protein [Chloroflexota bacterium]